MAVSDFPLGGIRLCWPGPVILAAHTVGSKLDSEIFYLSRGIRRRPDLFWPMDRGPALSPIRDQ
jgi:hypothetical protein